MARIIWTPQAAANLDAACAFIAQDSETYAMDFARRVVLAVEILATFPGAGRIVPEYQEETLRELICGNYRVIYEIVGDEVQILALHHGARLLPAGFER